MSKANVKGGGEKVTSDALFAKIVHSEGEVAYVNLDVAAEALARHVDEIAKACPLANTGTTEIVADLCTEKGTIVDIAGIDTSGGNAKQGLTLPSSDTNQGKRGTDILKPRATYILLQYDRLNPRLSSGKAGSRPGSSSMGKKEENIKAMFRPLLADFSKLYPNLDFQLPPRLDPRNRKKK